MIKNFDDDMNIILSALQHRARVLDDVLFEFGKTLTSSDELYELDQRQKQLQELHKLINKLKKLKNEQ